MKRRVLSIMGLLVALIGAMAIFTACGGKEETKAGEEADVYYCDAENGGENLLTLGVGGVTKYTLQIADLTVSGTYTLDGEVLTLRESEEKTVAATYSKTAVTLKYGDVTYRFLRKVDYTVKFDTKGGSTVESVTVMNGKKAAEPQDPEKGDLVFIGWYADEDFEDLYDFDTPVTKDLTLYARFEQKLAVEFTVTFDANGGTVETGSAETVGHKLYRLPVPAADSREFVGWWVGEYGTAGAKELSYQYVDQEIEENVTLFAVWKSDAPAVSVNATGVTWDAKGNNTTYQVKITPPEGEPVETTVSSANYGYDFAGGAAGKYTVQVTWEGNSTTVYYKNKVLARVSVFRVSETTLQFNGVKNAEGYTLEIVCGTPGHLHTDTELDANTTSYDFGGCAMGPDGIKFTITAHAEGYVSSVAETTVKRALGEVKNLSVDPETEEVTWDEVADAKYYHVKVTVGDEVEEQNVPAAHRSFSLKKYAAGTIRVEVTPVAAGWYSPAAATATYTKERLAAPQNLHIVSGTTLAWEAVGGAKGYEITVNGNVVGTTEQTTYTLAAVTETSTVTVRALAEDEAKNSAASDAVVIETGITEVTYSEGMIRWNYAYGESVFHIQVENGSKQSEVYEVSDTNEWKAVFLDSGTNRVYVWMGDDAASKMYVDVVAYKISFDVQYGEDAVDPLFVAEDTPLELPGADEVTRSGYDFVGWFTAPARGGRLYDDAFFTGKDDLTLYAAWDGSEYIIHFNVEGGSDEAPNDVTVKYGESYHWPVPKTNDVTKTFYGWFYEASSSSTRYTDEKGDSTRDYLVAGDLTVHAVWVEIFTFEPNRMNNGYYVSQNKDNIRLVTEITIPAQYKGMPVLNVEDFSKCYWLVRVNIPSSIQLIDLVDTAYAFVGCTKLQEINIYDPEDYDYNDTVRYASVDGVLFYYDEDADGGRTELAYYPVGRTETEYVIPSTVDFGDTVRTVDTIPSGAFWAQNGVNMVTTVLEKLTIPATIRLIEPKAIYYYRSVKTIVFEDEVTDGEAEKATTLDLEAEAFGNSTYSTVKVTEITLPQRLSAVAIDTLTAIETIKTVHVNGNTTYKEVDGLLLKSEGNELVFFPKGRAEPSYTIPAEIDAIGDKAFYGYTKLETLVVPAHVVKIGVSAFEGATKLASLTFGGNDDAPDLTIGSRAFYGASKLLTVAIPVNTKAIGAYAFGGTLHLTDVTIEASRGTTNDIAEKAFLTDASTPRGYVRTLRIGVKAPVIRISAVFGDSVENIYADGNENYRKDTDGVVYDKDQTTLLYVPAKITSYTFPATITAIADNTFKGKTHLASITIPKGVTSIGANAFNGCTALTTVEFEAAAEGEEEVPLTIGNSAFSGCTRLTNITLPDRLTSIGQTAFSGCSAIKALAIPAKVTSLGGSGTTFALYNMSNLTTLQVKEGNTNYKAVDNVLYSLRAAKDEAQPEKTVYVESELVFCPTKNESETITIPGTVTKLGTQALNGVYGLKTLKFEDSKKTTKPDGTEEGGTLTLEKNAINNCTNLTALELPKSGLTALNETFVNGASKLTSLTIPNTVTTINAKALQGMTGLVEIVFAEGGTASLAFPTGSTSSSLFNKCVNLTSVVLPARLTSTKTYAFYGLKKLTSVTFPEDSKCTEIGNFTFADCAALSDLKLPESVTTIGTYVFRNCISLKDMTIPAKVKSLGDNVFLSAGISSVKFGGTAEAKGKLTSIGKTAFSGCFALAEVDFGVVEAAFTIGDSAFLNCVSLESIELPAQAKSLGKTVFSGCYQLNTISFAKEGETSQMGSIGESAFAKTAFTNFTFPETTGTLTLGATLFTGCRLQTVYLSSKIEDVTNVFNGCVPDAIQISPSNNFLEAGSDGAKEIWKKATEEGKAKTLQVYYASLEGKLTVNDTEIPASKYKGQTEITTLEIGTDVNTIGASAFANCLGLQQVIILPGSKLQTVGASAFSQCSALTSINLATAENLSSIGASAFAGTTSLQSIELGAGITSIGASFLNGSGVKSADLSKAAKYTSLAASQFNGAAELTKLNLNKNVAGFGNSVFAGCSKLATIGTAESVDGLTADVADLSALSLTTIGNNAFQDWSGAKKVILPTTVTSLGASAFLNCSVEVIEGLDNVTSLGMSAFDGAGLKEFCFTKKMTTIGTYLFWESKIERVTFEEGCELDAIPVGMFWDSSLQEIDLTNLTQVTTIGTSAFRGCAQLESFDFTKLPNLASVGFRAFQGSGLTGADLSKTALTVVPGAMFLDCAALEWVKFPTTITSFERVYEDGRSGKTYPADAGAFQNCTSLLSVDLSECRQLVGIGENTGMAMYTFKGCSSLNEVLLPTQEICIGGYVFEDCVSLSEEGIDLNSVVGIGNYAFDNAGFVDLTLPVSVTGWYAASATGIGGADEGTSLSYTFANNHSLKSLVVPAGVKKLAGSMFLGCEQLASVTFEGVLGLNGSLGGTEIFNGCAALGSVDLSAAEITEIPEGMFLNCTSLSEIRLPDTVTFINSAAFAHTGLKELDLSNLTSLEKLGTVRTTGVFEGCDQLTSVTLPKTETFTVIGRYTFKDCVNLNSIDLTGTGITALTNDGGKRDSVGVVADVSDQTNTASYAFQGCTSLSSVTLPDTLTQIGGYAFDGCSSLTAFDFSHITRIGVSAFRGTGLQNVVLSKDLDTFIIGTSSASPFENCASLTSLSIDSEDAEGKRFNETGTFYTTNNMLFAVTADEAAGNVNKLVFVAGNKNFAEGKLDLSATNDLALGMYFLAGVANVTQVVLPETLTAIPDYAFYGSSVTTLTIPASVASIGQYAFAETPLQSIEIPANVTSIGAAAFYGCASLKNVTFATGEKEMTWADGSTTLTSTPGVFEGTALEHIVVPDRLTAVPVRAYRGVKAADVDLGNAESIGAYAFYEAGFTSVEIGEKVVRIGMYAFADGALTGITLPETVSEIGQYAFSGNTALASASVAKNFFYLDKDNKISTSNYLFSGCTSLTQVTLGDAVTVIYGYMFQNTGLTSFEVSEKIRSVEEGAFKGCVSLGSVTFKGVRSIGKDVFAGCTALTTVTINGGIAAMHKELFNTADTESITTINFAGSRYEVISACGLDWYKGVESKVHFGYTAE